MSSYELFIDYSYFNKDNIYMSTIEVAPYELGKLKSKFYDCIYTAYTLKDKDKILEVSNMKLSELFKYFYNCDKGEIETYGIRDDIEHIDVSLAKALMLSKYYNSTKALDKLNSFYLVDMHEYNKIHDNYWGYCTCPLCKYREHFNLLGGIERDIKILFSKYKVTDFESCEELQRFAISDVTYDTIVKYIK